MADNELLIVPGGNTAKNLRFLEGWGKDVLPKSNMYSLDAFTTKYHLPSIRHAVIVPLSFKTISMILNDQSKGSTGWIV